ncbi:hypothetical protein OS242_20820 [Tumebacillus sp. DT12]|uniref:Uncharacterized protein n=1 Tax=Tumebacillus lacus TaxID=2995335 RepID=A0ABT3X626_9BACL|nr:hypothetical protein [Tumebacillus lacus]MCX7572355.1 hypothetical protein [Tumebacillus lacus]
MLFHNPFLRRTTRVIALSALLLTGWLGLDAEDPADAAALDLGIARLHLGSETGVSAQVDVPLLSDMPLLKADTNGAGLRMETPVLDAELDVPDLNLRVDTPVLDTELDVPDLNLRVDTPVLDTELDIPDRNLRVDTPVLDAELDADVFLPLPAPQKPQPNRKPTSAPDPTPAQMPRAVPNLPAPEASLATERKAVSVQSQAAVPLSTPLPPLPGPSAAEGNSSHNGNGTHAPHPAVAAKGLHLQAPGGRSVSYSETTADFTDWSQAPPGRPPHAPSSH